MKQGIPVNSKPRDTKCLYAGRYLGLYETEGWEYVSRENATGVVVLIAVNETQELLLVEQFRPAVGQSVIELPAGLAGDLDDPGESLLQAAQRELLEETGYQAGRLELLLSCPSSAGMSDEIVSFVLASGLQQLGPGGGDDSEDIRVHAVPLAEADRWLAGCLDRGLLLDPKIYSALYWLQQRNS